MSSTTWHLPVYAGLWLSDDDLTAVTDWMDANGLARATADRPVIVDDAGQITYGQDRSGPNARRPHRDIVMRTLPLRSEPPQIWLPAARALPALEKVLDTHEWTTGFGGACVDCSYTTTSATGQIMCRREDVVLWPCPPVRSALIEAGIPVPPPVPGQDSLLVLGDGLDRRVHAHVFGDTDEAAAS
jgi:hypothetical protein